MRLFFALMLPPEVQRQLGSYKQKLSWIRSAASWVPGRNIHITLNFLGEVSDDRVMPLIDAVKAAVVSAGPAVLKPDHAVMFPPAKAIRVLAAGFAGDTSRVGLLHDQLEKVCESQGFARERRGFVPHATLARFRNPLHANHRGQIEETLRDLASLPEFTLTQFQLMQSILDPQGSQYMPVATFEL